MKHLGLVFLVISFVWFSSCGALEEKRKGDQNETTQENVTDDSTDVVDESEKVEENENKVAVVTEEANETAVNEKTQKKYYVIVGSFTKETNAKELHSKLKKSGMPSEVLDAENNFRRVSKKSFDTRAEALKELKKVQTKDKQIDAWILTGNQ